MITLNMRKPDSIMTDALDLSYNFGETYMKDIYRRIADEWDNKIKGYIRENLKQFGHHFETEAEFFEFCKTRVRRVGFQDKPNEWEFYLDYADEKNTGKLIGICSDKMSFKENEGKITLTIG